MNTSDNFSQIDIDRNNSLFNTESSQDTVKKIFGEVSRETDIHAIHRESQESFSEATLGKDLKTYLEQLKKAQEKIKEWKQNGGLDRSLEKIKTTSDSLGKEGKSSLEELYLMQAKLRETTNNLLQKLQNTNQDSAVNIEGSLLKKDEYTWQDVQRALQWIEWKKGGDLKFRVKYLDEAKRIIYQPRDEEESSYGWGGWNKNPFRIFFSSKEVYENTMKRIEDAEEFMKKFLVGQGMLETIDKTKVVVSDTLQRVGNRESEFKAKVSEAILDLEMQVASKLVEWIQPKLEQSEES